MRKASKFALSTLVAGVTGYLAGILSAPRSGERTRKKLAKSASQARVDGERQLKELYTDLHKLVKDGEN